MYILLWFPILDLKNKLTHTQTHLKSTQCFRLLVSHTHSLIMTIIYKCGNVKYCKLKNFHPMFSLLLLFCCLCEKYHTRCSILILFALLQNCISINYYSKVLYVPLFEMGWSFYCKQKLEKWKITWVNEFNEGSFSESGFLHVEWNFFVCFQLFLRFCNWFLDFIITIKDRVSIQRNFY